MYTEEGPTDPSLTFWPNYGHTDEGRAELSDREVAFVRSQFAGKTTMIDRWFGQVLDALSEKDLWDETRVIVTSDHGHFLGEHGWIGKPRAPLYDVLAHTPLMIWHPDGVRSGERVDEVTAAVDVYATVLDAMGVDGVSHRHSQTLVPYLTGKADDHRDWAVYGYWGSSINVTDGRYTYHHPCDESVGSYCYSAGMMNTALRELFDTPKPHLDAEPDSLPYTESPVWKYAGPSHGRHDEPLLFDTATDADQDLNLALDRPEKVREMRAVLCDAMASLDAPSWQYDRLGLDRTDARQ